MLEFCNVIDGAVLNHLDGHEDGTGLEFTVQGIARGTDEVTLNGVPAVRNGDAFSATIRLTSKLNDIEAVAEGGRGITTRKIRVLWDKASFRRTGFCMDDNIFFLAEIARDKPRSLFEHFYLKRLREIHKKYGLKLVLNLFYRNDHFPFELNQFPDTYREEWEDNADWLRLAFHAYSEFPDRPYQLTEPDVIARDYDLITSEIVRFAGASTLIAPTNIHWAMCRPDSLAALRERGVNYQAGSFMLSLGINRDHPSKIATTDIGFFQSEEDSRYLCQNHVRYDNRHQMLFAWECIVCNSCPLPEIRAKLGKYVADPRREVLNLISHEQYSYPFYMNYIPDHLDRIEEAARILNENGYRYVFLAEGVQGNLSWNE